MSNHAMRNRAWPLVISAALTGCTFINVQHDYDPDVVFDNYKTFAWMPLDPGDTVDGSSLSAPFMDKHMRKAVVEALSAKGYVLQPEGADFLVAYHLHYRRKKEIEVQGYGYGPYAYRGYPYRGTQAVDVSRFKEGTLVVDLVDPESMELIWRGWCVSELNLNSSPKEERERVDIAVKAILERFPPY